MSLKVRISMNALCRSIVASTNCMLLSTCTRTTTNYRRLSELETSDASNNPLFSVLVSYPEYLRQQQTHDTTGSIEWTTVTRKHRCVLNFVGHI